MRRLFEPVFLVRRHYPMVEGDLLSEKCPFLGNTKYLVTRKREILGRWASGRTEGHMGAILKNEFREQRFQRLHLLEKGGAEHPTQLQRLRAVFRLSVYS